MRVRRAGEPEVPRWRRSGQRTTTVAPRDTCRIAHSCRATPPSLAKRAVTQHPLSEDAVSDFELALHHTATVTRRKVAEIDVASARALLFWLSNSSFSSRCKSAARPLSSAAANAFIVGP
jgi:hypothetical protein